MSRPLVAFALLATIGLTADAPAQSRPRATGKTAPPPPATIAAADVSCPNVLGRGVRTRLVYCDVVIGRNPADGIRIKLPPHTGPVRLTFVLHNRHLYSEEQTRAGKAFMRYSATIGALAPDGTLIRRAMVQSEFRNTRDLVDRIESGPAAPVKAVAPTGAEPIVIELPASLDEVSLLGEKLEAAGLDSREVYTSPGRLIATISDFKVEYRPKPASRAPAKPSKPKG